MIEFDESRHLYKVNGRVIPSVTQILNHNKQNFYKDNGADITGTIVHKLLEDYDNGKNVDFYGEEYLTYLEQYKAFKEDYEPSWDHIERRVYDEFMEYCGTVDRAGFFKNKRVVLDIKTGSSVPAWAALQTAAYANALYPNDYPDVFRMVLHINPKKLKTYKVKVYSDQLDFDRWELSCRNYHKEVKEMEDRF